MSKFKALPLPLLINAAISNPDSLLDDKKFGRLCIIGKSDNGRGTPFGIYTNLADVAADYGVEAGEYLQAKKFFSQVETGEILITTAEYASIIRPVKIEPIPDPEPEEPDDEDFESEYISIGYEPLDPSPVYPLPPDPDPEPIKYSHIYNANEYALFNAANVNLYINGLLASIGDEFVIGDTLTVKGDGYIVTNVVYGAGENKKTFDIVDGIATATMTYWDTGNFIDIIMTNELLSVIDFSLVESVEVVEPEPELPACRASYANFNVADLSLIGGASELSFWTIAVVNGIEYRVGWSSMPSDVFTGFIDENGAGLTANMLFASMMYELSKSYPIAGDYLATHTNLLASSFDYGKRLSGIDSTNKDDLKDTIEYIGGQASAFRSEPTVITFKNLSAGELAGKNSGGTKAINMLSMFNRAKDFLLNSCMAFDYNKPVEVMTNVFSFSTFNGAPDDGGYDEDLTIYKELPLGIYLNGSYHSDSGTKFPMPAWRLERDGEIIADSDGFKVDDVRIVLDSEHLIESGESGATGTFSTYYDLAIFVGKGDKTLNNYELKFSDSAENLDIFIENKGAGSSGGSESWIDIDNFCPAISHYEFSMHRSASTTKLIVPDNLPAHIFDISNMFSWVPEFNQDISLWDTSNVKYMNRTFAGCYLFNQPLGRWDVSNVVEMSQMLYGCYAFRQNLNSWCVQHITPAQGAEFVKNTNYEPLFGDNGNQIPEAAPIWGTCPGVITIPGKNTIPNPDANLKFERVVINTGMIGGILASKFKIDIKFGNGVWLDTVNADYSQNLTDMVIPGVIVTANGTNGIEFTTDFLDEIITVKLTAIDEQKAVSNEFLLGDGIYQADTGQFAFNLFVADPYGDGGNDPYPADDFTSSSPSDTVWDLPPAGVAYPSVTINNIESVKSLTSKYMVEIYFEEDGDVVNGPYNTFYTHNLHEHNPNQIGFSIDEITGNITITPTYQGLPMVVRLTPNPSQPKTSNGYVDGDGNYNPDTGVFTFRLDSSSV